MSQPRPCSVVEGRIRNQATEALDAVGCNPETRERILARLEEFISQYGLGSTEKPVPQLRVWPRSAADQSKIGGMFALDKSYTTGAISHGVYRIKMGAYSDPSKWFERLRAAVTISDTDLSHPKWLDDLNQLFGQIDKDTLLFVIHVLVA